MLIEPGTAASYEEATRPPPIEAVGAPTSKESAGATETATANTGGTVAAATTRTNVTGSTKLTHFWASAELDPVGASLKFANIMNELVELFSARHGTSVVIKVDIEASDSRGFDEATVRAAKENSRVVGFPRQNLMGKRTV